MAFYVTYLYARGAHAQNSKILVDSQLASLTNQSLLKIKFPLTIFA